jgi:uncharacterized protein (TIGR02246 family)
MSKGKTMIQPTALVDQLAQSFNTRNALAFANLFAEDAEFVNIFGQRMRQRSGIASGHQMVFETLLAGTHLAVNQVDVMPLGEDVVLMHATWTRERLPEARATALPPGSGIFTLVARRASDGWELVGVTNVQDALPPGPLR